MVERVKKKYQIQKFIQDNKPDIIEVKDISYIIEIYKSFWGRVHLFPNADFKKIIKQKLSYSYKIEKELVAYCLVEYIKNDDIIEIDLLCVKKEYQGYHLGKSLLSFCINNCCNLNMKKFRIYVSINNLKAISLYKKLGFTTKNLIKNYYYQEPKDKDAYCMILNMP